MKIMVVIVVVEVSPALLIVLFGLSFFSQGKMSRLSAVVSVGVLVVVLLLPLLLTKVAS